MAVVHVSAYAPTIQTMLTVRPPNSYHWYVYSLPIRIINKSHVFDGAAESHRRPRLGTGCAHTSIMMSHAIVVVMACVPSLVRLIDRPRGRPGLPLPLEPGSGCPEPRSSARDRRRFCILKNEDENLASWRVIPIQKNKNTNNENLLLGCNNVSNIPRFMEMMWA